MQNPIQRSNKWTILEIINWSTDYFKSHQIDSPRTTSELFLAHVLHLRRIDLYLRYDQPLTEDELSRYKALIKKRIKREPVAYILGTREFWSLELDVSPHTLIPRPDTECLVESALTFLPKAEEKGRYHVVDLGTGSGAIILALAKERPGHHFLAVDRSLEALKVAKQNAAKHGLEKEVDFFNGEWLTLFKPRPVFDLIVSNPPYIPTEVLSTLQPEVVDFEPAGALDGGEDGLKCLKQIIGDAHLFLKPAGLLLLEIGFDQKEDIETFIIECGHYDHVDFYKDYGGHNRVVKMQKMIQSSDKE